MEVIEIPETEGEQCPICFEAKEDLRTLPCWHIGCLTCILGMTQAGNSRAVTCHMCRQPCLFENIRSLPRAVRCATCNNFVKNPKKFPCCSNLHCSECLNKKSVDGKIACQKFCSYNLYDVGVLPSARLCSTCFAYHTMDPAGCGHLFCSKCMEERVNQATGCPVCVAVTTPSPGPTDPFSRASPGQGEAYAALQMIRMLNQRRVGGAQLERHQELADAMQLQIKNDLIKGFTFLVVLSIASYFLGLNLKLWVVGFLTMIILRPSLICASVACAFVNLWLLIVSFYYYFWDAMLLIFVDTLIGVVLREIGKTSSNKFIFPFLAWVVVLGFFIATVLFFPAIFIHRMALAIVVQNVGRFGNIV